MSATLGDGPVPGGRATQNCSPLPKNAGGSATIVRPFAFGDAPTADLADDALGFVPYVGAVRDFLMHPETQTPLTMSVEGEWGSGKSSFLLQLQQALSQAKRKTVFFNAWRHNKDESLWAAFALECIAQLRAGQTAPQHIFSSFLLAIDRLNWSAAWPDALRFFARLTVLVIATAVLVWLLAYHGAAWLAGAVAAKDNDQLIALLFGGTGVVGYILILAIAQKKLREAFGDPFEIKLQQYVQDPGYKSRVDFVETFHEDFARITSRFAGGSRVFILIDDLDRCDVPKVADLTQTINQLTSTDVGKGRTDARASANGKKNRKDAQLVFIIGMDRELVAASLAARYEPLLPYLTLSAGENGSTREQRGIDYGYAFMEKLIQLPFRVPTATAQSLGNLQLDSKDVAPQVLNKDPTFELNVKDSERIRALVQAVEFVFDHNPRRIKQFINLLRLQVYIGVRTETLDVAREYTDQEAPRPTDVTVEKLGKFLALVLRWPRFVDALTQEKGLLSELQRRALGYPSADGSKVASQWSEAEPALMALLAVMDDEAYPEVRLSRETLTCIFGLETLNVDRLLNAAPTAGLRPTPAKPRLKDPETNLVVRDFLPAGLPCLLQHKYEGHDLTLELLVPSETGGLGHFVRECNALPNGWRPHKLLAEHDKFQAVSLIQSDFDNGNLELVARFGENLSHFWRFADSIAKWRGPYDLFNVRGRPNLLQERSKRHGNFELVAGLRPTGLAHWWRDNSGIFRPWRGPLAFMMDSSTAEVLALFPAIDGRPGDLTAVVLDEERLMIIERRRFDWLTPVKSQVRFTIPPAVLQRDGIAGELVVIYAKDSRLTYAVLPRGYAQLMQHETIHENIAGVDALVAASNREGRVDIVARAKQSLYHFLRDSEGEPWQGPIDVLAEAARDQ